MIINMHGGGGGGGGRNPYTSFAPKWASKQGERIHSGGYTHS